ncbi:RNF115 [Bugula neritina]|uniref:RNF115 n=1 Tax=Bugula neritina TaxID=10212 RepID=A0A7J7KTR5_BUGNE|nr:RNF115 [Bugula neritina]
MPVEFNSLFNLLSNMGGLNFGMSEVHGNPGDYAWGAGALDTIITQLLNSVDGAGPPPADSATIEGLPSVKITAAQVENGIQCFVCV